GFDELLLRHLGAARDTGIARPLVELGLAQGVEVSVRGVPVPGGRLALAASGRLDARPQSRQQVGRLLLLDLRCAVNLLAFPLRLDHLEKRVAVGVLVLLGLPLAGEALDQLRGHLQLVARDLCLPRPDLVYRADLVGEIELLEGDRPLAYAQRAEV